MLSKSSLKNKKEVKKMTRQKWSKKEEDYLIKNPPKEDGDYKKLAKKLNRTPESIRKKCRKLNLSNIKRVTRDDFPLEERVKTFLSGTRKSVTIEELSDTFDVSVKRIREAIKILKEKKVIVDVVDEKISLGKTLKPPEPIKIPMEVFRNRWIKFGVISDSHLNSKYQRAEVLRHAYDVFEEEGVSQVFQTGNMIDGYGRLNQYDVFNIGAEDQVKYLVENYPYKKGITTRFITADDHEGWIVQREHINIGERIEDKARRIGREDLVHVGYLEADILVDIGNKPTRIRLFHPGGGSSYALSYKPQKIVESLQGGEKPDILLVGHFHKLGVFSWRNVWVILTGCTQDQTPFMRKKNIAAHVGFSIIKAHIAPDGSVNRLIPEIVSYYDRNYYRKNSWTKMPNEFEKPIEWFYKW
jgi:predicted phosphodiesterase